MLSKEQNLKMVKLQDTINSAINPNWLIANNNWLLAGAMELMEAIDHYGWKWWKASKCDIAQAQLEMVDYWHFVLSKSIIYSQSPESAIYWLMPNEAKPKDVLTFDNKGYVIAEMSVVEKMFLIVGLSASGRFEFYLFESLLKDLDMTWNNLYFQYVGKNVLNLFRQKNGYKTGEYIKIWFDGREDNEHMIEALEELALDLSHDPDTFVLELEFELARRYAETIGQKPKAHHIGGEHEIKEQDKN